MIIFFDGIINLYCSNSIDQLSVSNDNAKLRYSVGLAYVNELNLLGNKKLINSSVDYWVLCQKYFDDNIGYVYYVKSDGSLTYASSNTSKGIRSVISLKTGTKYVSGDGSTDSPYVVE